MIVHKYNLAQHIMNNDNESEQVRNYFLRKRQTSCLIVSRFYFTNKNYSEVLKWPFGNIKILRDNFFGIRAALVICGLFISEFAYMRLKNGLFLEPILLLSFYMRAYLWSLYLSHIMRSTCTSNPLPLWCYVTPNIIFF